MSVAQYFLCFFFRGGKSTLEQAVYTFNACCYWLQVIASCLLLNRFCFDLR